MIRVRSHAYVHNETVPWTREAFLQIRPRSRFIWLTADTMRAMADLIELNQGPAVIFRNEVNGPWAAVGIFNITAPLRRKTGEVWVVQSRAMFRNLGYFNRQCLDCLHFYADRYGYQVLRCHVRASWHTSRKWVEGFGFEQVGFTVYPGMPEMMIEYQWRPPHGR